MLSEAPAPFDRRGWLFELKYDGFRILAAKRGAEVRLLTRRGNDLGAAFPEIVAEMAKLPDCALDGELVVADQKGVPQFDVLAARARKTRPRSIEHAARQMPASLLAFDLLAEKDEDLRGRPLIERKARLAKLIRGSPRIKYVDHLPQHGRQLYAAADHAGLEGIVAKNGDSPYRRGRSRDWLKIKTPAGRKLAQERADTWYGGAQETSPAEPTNEAGQHRGGAAPRARRPATARAPARRARS